MGSIVSSIIAPMSTTNERGSDTATAATAHGPALVSLGAAGWGAENYFRTRLGTLELTAYPIVLVEHLLQVVFTLPHLLRNLGKLRKVSARALGYVFLSGSVGSALGTVCYTAALGTSMNKTAAAVLLNLQPLVSTLAGAMLFHERISRRFFLWAPVAIVAGMGIAVPGMSQLGGLSLQAQGGLGLVMATVVLWGFATVAGRGAMRELPLGLATPLRLWAGLLTVALVLGLRVATGREHLDLAAFLTGPAVQNMLLLTTLTGVVPLVIYFAGLRTTPASIAGYCEMFYTVSATLVGWALLKNKLMPHQAIAGAVLIVAVVMLNRSQRPVTEPRVAEKHAA